MSAVPPVTMLGAGIGPSILIPLLVVVAGVVLIVLARPGSANA